MELPEQIKEGIGEKKIVIRAIIIIAVGWFLYFAFTTYGDYRQEKELIKRTVAEEKIKQLAKEDVERDIRMVAIKRHSDSLQVILEYQQKYPNILIKENYEKHLSIDRLNAANTIVEFTNDLNDYRSQRERYALIRFHTRP